MVETSSDYRDGQGRTRTCILALVRAASEHPGTGENPMTLEQERQKRIVTTHVGSLPRPDALSHMMADGDTHSPAYFDAVGQAVNEIVRHQVEVGLDVVDDGEQSKPGFITYIHERLGGMEARKDNPPQI